MYFRRYTFLAPLLHTFRPLSMIRVWRHILTFSTPYRHRRHVKCKRVWKGSSWSCESGGVSWPVHRPQSRPCPLHDDVSPFPSAYIFTTAPLLLVVRLQLFHEHLQCGLYVTRCCAHAEALCELIRWKINQSSIHDCGDAWRVHRSREVLNFLGLP